MESFRNRRHQSKTSHIFRHRSNVDEIEDKTNEMTSEYLELESSHCNSGLTSTSPRNLDVNDIELDLNFGGLMTKSGLLLTHRQINDSGKMSIFDHIQLHKKDSHGKFDKSGLYSRLYGNESISRERSILSVARIWIGLFTVILIMGSVTMWSLSHNEKSFVNNVPDTAAAQIERIILMPLPTNSTQELTLSTPKKRGSVETGVSNGRNALHHLHQEFEEWITKHKKQYSSHDEKKRRFHAWKKNRVESETKNKRHGPCPITKTTVFGSNLFQDMTTEEFQSKFLTGYKGPQRDIPHTGPTNKRPHSESALNPQSGPLFNVSVQSKYESYLQLEHLHEGLSLDALNGGSCIWYDIYCWLRFLLSKYGFHIGVTMKPNYDYNSVPRVIDWRDFGAVTEIHSQGNCGACWAITAVETIESVHAIHSGKLFDLAESEVIMCDDTCDLCNGGWPQNAYDYVMTHKGLPLEQKSSYDGEVLMELTYSKTGLSSTYSYDDIRAEVCPKEGSDGNGMSRYGNIAGYGYSTNRCICYTDGTGCNCDTQNELLAIQNIASYGPATVCLDASLWQDYSGGVITSQTGCSSRFLDMNHCVQIVGYVLLNSEDNIGDQPTKDMPQSGYWIVRNQWSEEWGMKGYAYLSMGENTCGVLNDMTNVFL
jgi:Papain family cysteine protease/Cathepsin propeptide inhibitor domain (I29)